MNKYIEFDGLKVSYMVMGAGRPIVLLHGYLEAGEVWQPLTDRLSGDFRHLGFIEETERSAELITGFARKLDW